MTMYLEEIAAQSQSSPYEELGRAKNGLQKQRFVDHYVTDPSSATQAARRAKYAKISSADTAMKLLNEPLVQAAIAEKMNERIERTKITQDRILQELAIIGFSNLDNYQMNPATGFVSNQDGAPDYVMRAISSIKFITTIDEDGNTTIKTEIRLWDKLAALRMMGQHLGELTVRQKWNVGGKEIIF
jgi:phage terminase small subunit